MKGKQIQWRKICNSIFKNAKTTDYDYVCVNFNLL